MSSFTIRRYQKNAFIIIEGEVKNDSFYIVKEGLVSVTKKFPVFGEKHQETLGPGDFFGVVGALSHLPHLESAVASSNVLLISINRKQFPIIVQENIPLAIKIIRFFSKKLREFNDREIDLKVTVHGDNENFRTLLNIANVYMQELRRSRIAAYMYRCINYYSSDTQAGRIAREKLEKLEYDTTFTKKTGIFRTYLDGDIIFCENEPADEVYILKHGKVRISKLINGADAQIFIMHSGDVFGEMALLDNKTRSATAVAMEDSEILIITKANFDMMTRKEPQLITKLITLLADRIWTSNKISMVSYFPDMESKILEVLMVNFERSRTRLGIGDQTYNFNLSFADIIFMIGTNERIDKLESSFLASHKYIKIEKNSIVCTDMQQLLRQVGALRAKNLVSKH